MMTAVAIWRTLAAVDPGEIAETAMVRRRQRALMPTIVSSTTWGDIRGAGSLGGVNFMSEWGGCWVERSIYMEFCRKERLVGNDATPTIHSKGMVGENLDFHS